MRYFIAIAPPPLQEQAVLSFRQDWNLTGIAPHITVKAPCGLGNAENWLPFVQQLCQATPAPFVRLSQAKVFNPAILYWHVDSPAIHVLHHQLLQLLATSATDQAECFEGERYVPHLTLAHLGDVLDSQRPALLKAANDMFSEPVEFVGNFLDVYGKRNEEPYQKMWSIPFLSQY